MKTTIAETAPPAAGAPRVGPTFKERRLLFWRRLTLRLAVFFARRAHGVVLEVSAYRAAVEMLAQSHTFVAKSGGLGRFPAARMKLTRGYKETLELLSLAERVAAPKLFARSPVTVQAFIRGQLAALSGRQRKALQLRAQQMKEAS